MDIPPETCELLLTGGSVLTVDDDRNVFEPGALAISGDRIAAVGSVEDLAHYRAGRTIDTTGMAVVPGFVDTHQHLFQYLLRGLGEGLDLWTWLSEFMYPVSTAITPAQARVGVQLGAAEAARSGVTAVLDNHFAPTDLETTLAVADGIAEVGIRGAVARGILGEPTEMASKHGLAGELFRFSNEEELEITAAAIDERPPGSRVGVWPAPLDVIYLDQELLRRSVALARDRGTSWHTHCSQVETDPVYYLEEYGIRPVDWLYEEGLLGLDATLAHGIFFDDQEVERVGETGTGIAYCPISHQYIALGVMRLRDLRRAGATVGLGLDAAGGHRLDMMACMKQAILLQRVHSRDPTISNGEEALELATRSGADYMRIDAGYLAPGRLADVAVINVSKLHHLPVHRTVATIVYAAAASDVEYTIVGGTVVLDEGRLTQIDEESLLSEVKARSAELVESAGLAHLSQPWRSSPHDAGQ